MEQLSKLFGSPARVKLMKLFLFNQDKAFASDDLSRRTQIRLPLARRELQLLSKAGMLKKKKVIGESSGRSVNGFILNPSFAYTQALYNLLIETSTFSHKDVVSKVSRAGRVKLIIVSGVFTQNWDGRVDLLVVGDNLRQSTLENTVRALEAEVGRELRFASFETQDFKYRLSIYDRLIRDILDYPHQKILDKIGV